MREALLKKRFGVPAALLVALLISIGVACATFVVVTVRTATSIREPILVTETTEFSAVMDPGTYNTWEFTVKNESASVNYDISYHVINGVNDEKGVSVTTFKIDSTDYLDALKGDDDKVGPCDAVIDKVNHGITKTVTLTIYAETDAPAPQSVDLAIEIGRE